MVSKSYPKTAPTTLAWLHEHGFTRETGCTWVRVGQIAGEIWYVWVHGNGGQAEIKIHGRKFTRCESWRDVAQLERFFGLEEYAAVGAAQ